MAYWLSDVQVSRFTNGPVSVMSQSRRVEWLESRLTEGGFNASTLSTVLARLNYLNFSSCFCCLRICALPSGTFFCFPSGFFSGLCFGLVYWSRSSHITQQLSPAGVWRRKCSACHLLSTKGCVLTCWAAPAACWYGSAHGLSAGSFALLTKNFALAVRETVKSHPTLSSPSPKICLLLLLSAMFLLENKPDNCSFSASSCLPC